jgi:hypothetical protein
MAPGLRLLHAKLKIVNNTGSKSGFAAFRAVRLSLTDKGMPEN